MVSSKEVYKYLVALFLVGFLLIFTFLIIRPIFLSIVFGLILGYIFSPVYNRFLSLLKNKTLAASLTCCIIVLVLVVILWFSVPLLAVQAFDMYSEFQSWDVSLVLQDTLTPLFGSSQLTDSIISIYNSFFSNSAQKIFSKMTSVITNIPGITLQLLIVLVIFFYTLRDSDKFIDLIEDIIPFEKQITRKFIKKSKEVTFSVIYGRFVIGIITGLATGVGFYFAGVGNVTLLTFLSILAAVIPIIGPWLIWVPVVISLFVSGNTVAAFLLMIYSAIFVTFFIDNLLTIAFISNKSKLPNSLMLVGVVGGLFFFGIMGIFLGPLIIAYLVVLYEVYVTYIKD